jgi:hypothetical protein
MPLTQLIRLVDQSKYAEDLGGLRLEDLLAPVRAPLRLAPNEAIDPIWETTGCGWAESLCSAPFVSSGASGLARRGHVARRTVRAERGGW